MASLVNRLLNFQQLKLCGESLLTSSHELPTLSVLPVACQWNFVQVRRRTQNRPKLKYPLWYLKKERVQYPEMLTQENVSFIKEVVHDKFGPPAILSGIPTFQVPISPLKDQPIAKGEWTISTRRTGLIARKIGQYPMWLNNGQIIWTTLLQVADNHVIKYTPPEEVDSPKKVERFKKLNKFGRLLVGAEFGDPQLYTKEYCGLFAEAGLPPKKFLGKFLITPNAVIQPGTPLYASHFQPGDVVDVCGKTIDHGFQGVMKRWGFKGMPASHGVTKTHRRGGNVGGGGEKGRIWPGTKMPGHMGNRWRVHRGAKIWRINTKYNVIYVQGLAIPGETNSMVYIHDTLLRLKKKKEAPLSFPTFYPELSDPLPEDLYDPEVHIFDAPTISYNEKS